jgi:hypothetical protein
VLALGAALAGCGAGGVAVSGSPTAPTAQSRAAQSPTAPVWHVGDQWAFRWESAEGQGAYVWTVDRLQSIAGVKHYVIRSGPREIYFRAVDLATSLETLAGQVERRNLPPRLGFSWPLSPGTMWHQRYVEEGDARTPAERALDWTVESEDVVRVAGGSFKTLRIVARYYPTPDVVYEMWYAPEVKQWVRLKEYFPSGIRERELTDFTLR